jgi:radical SAM superfamily enzyme YgiQ (UPF0313 family)
MEMPAMAPLGLAFIAGTLCQQGWRVRILDNAVERLEPTRIAAQVRESGAFVAGIACTSLSFHNTLRVAGALRGATSARVVVGGPHATLMPETLMVPCVDFVVSGEGEITMAELCAGLRDGTDASLIAGLHCRLEEGRWQRTAVRPRLANLDVLPHPRRDLMPVNRYLNQTTEVAAGRVLSASTSRGCPYDCAFCSVEGVWGRGYRSFSASWVLDDLEELASVYQADGVYFYEDNFTLNQKRVAALCQGLRERRPNLRWACEGRIGSLSPELLREMKAAGCQTVKFGIESGSPRILQLIAKDIVLPAVLDTRRLCRQAGLRFACFFMVGLPGETDEDRRQTLEFVRRLQPDLIIVNVFTPIPRSKLYLGLLKGRRFASMDDNFVLHPPPEQQRAMEAWAARLREAADCRN